MRSDASGDRHHRVDLHTVEVGLAVKLVDALTGGRPLGNPTVRIEGVTADPVENRSGYHVFLDLDPSDGPFGVLVDGGERYLDTNREVRVSMQTTDERGNEESTDDRTVEGDVNNEGSDPVVVPSTVPALRIDLHPSPAYRFPTNTTLVRGHVRDMNRKGVVDARLSVRGLDVSTRSVRNGEFVLLFRDSPAIDIERVGQGGASEESGDAGNGNGNDMRTGGPETGTERTDRRFLKIDGEDPTIDIEPPDDRLDLGSTSISLAVEEGRITTLSSCEIIITD